ncbi:MAG: TlpA family protein disulfide reductase, partial [Owenweeksia sp.]
MFKKPLFIILCAGLAFAGLSFVEGYHEELTLEDQGKVLNIGDKAPELSFTDPEGNTRSLSDLKGKVVLIDFWASW